MLRQLAALEFPKRRGPEKVCFMVSWFNFLGTRGAREHSEPPQPLKVPVGLGFQFTGSLLAKSGVSGFGVLRVEGFGFRGQC